MKVIKITKKRKDPNPPSLSLREQIQPHTKNSKNKVLQNPMEHSGRKTMTMLKNGKNKIFFLQGLILDH